MSVVWLKKNQESKKKGTFHILVSYDETFYFKLKTAVFSIKNNNYNNHKPVFLFLALKHILFIFMWVLHKVCFDTRFGI